MGIKENFSQALKELTGANTRDDKKNVAEKKDVSVDSMKRSINEEEALLNAAAEQSAVSSEPTQPARETPEAFNINLGSPINKSFDAQPEQKETIPLRDYSEAATAPAPEEVSFERPAAEPSYTEESSYSDIPENVPQSFSTINDTYDNNELTVISKNTVIDGNIRSFANMSIDGDIKGDVETTKNIDLNGKVVGNLTCNNAEMKASQIQGNVRMKGSVAMGRDTLLIGDLISNYADVNGKIKGNLDISGKASLKSDAVVFGDISASTITVDDGAIIQGYVSTTFLNKEESRNIFPDAISISE